jgi:hypothetical protein
VISPRFGHKAVSVSSQAACYSAWSATSGHAMARKLSSVTFGSKRMPLHAASAAWTGPMSPS